MENTEGRYILRYIPTEERYWYLIPVGVIVVIAVFFLTFKSASSLSTSLESQYHCTYPLNNTCIGFIQTGLLPYPLPNIPNVSRAVNNTNQFIEVPQGQFNQPITWSLGYACLIDGNWHPISEPYNNVLVTKYTFNATTGFVTIDCVGYGNPTDTLYNWTVEQFYET